MKNLNFLLVIFLVTVLAVVLWVRMNKVVKVVPPPPIDDTSIVIPDKEVIPEEPKIDEIKNEILVDAKSYAEALKMAKEHKRPIFLFFGASWCHWCVQMKNGTLSNEEVKKKLATEYIVYFVDTDKHKPLTRKYRISGIPVSMIISEDENVIAKISGAMSKDEFFKFLDDKPNSSEKSHKTSLIEHNFDE